MKKDDFNWNNHKMRKKNYVKLYLHCSGGRWSLRVEDQSKSKRWNMKR